MPCGDQATRKELPGLRMSAGFQARGGTIRAEVEVKVSHEQRRLLEAVAGDGARELKHARRTRVTLLADKALGTMAVTVNYGGHRKADGQRVNGADWRRGL